jgi:2'-5' RNA ligase
MATNETPDNTDLLELYNRLWTEAAAHFHGGAVQTDPFLLNRHHDRRQGFSVIARPSQAVKEHISAMLRRLRPLAPDQYFYRKADLHTTVLSLFTATADFEAYLANQADYMAAVTSALAGARRFAVDYRGVTASKNAIMVQGFPRDSALNQLRTNLRQALRSRGLGAGLDQRYQIITAHATVMRFRTQPPNLSELIDGLISYRTHYFGQTTIDTLQLVRHDWYMSADKVVVLAEYRLA